MCDRKFDFLHGTHTENTSNIYREHMGDTRREGEYTGNIQGKHGGHTSPRQVIRAITGGNNRIYVHKWDIQGTQRKKNTALCCDHHTVKEIMKFCTTSMPLRFIFKIFLNS